MGGKVLRPPIKISAPDIDDSLVVGKELQKECAYALTCIDFAMREDKSTFWLLRSRFS